MKTIKQIEKGICFETQYKLCLQTLLKNDKTSCELFIFFKSLSKHYELAVSIYKQFHRQKEDVNPSSNIPIRVRKLY